MLTLIVLTIPIPEKMRIFDLIDMRHHCTGTYFQLSSFSADVQFEYLFKIGHIHTFLLSKASFYAIIIRIGDDKILTGTPTPASRLYSFEKKIKERCQKDK